MFTERGDQDTTILCQEKVIIATLETRASEVTLPFPENKNTSGVVFCQQVSLRALCSRAH